MCRQRRAICVLLALLSILVGPALAAQASASGTPATRPEIRIYAAEGEIRGALVLLPGWGSGADSFELSSPSTPSTLPARLAVEGILTLVAVVERETLYETDSVLLALDSLLDAVIRQYRIPRTRVAFGGFSAGGTGAVRYAQLCAQQKCRAIDHVVAVFAVDPPLDLERLHRSSSITIARGAARSNVEEARLILETLEQSLGGTPDDALATYERHSAVLASATNGGNALLLKDTPVRLYTEPDVQWWLEQRNLDYHGMNAVDHAALINLLRVAGNARAELITTSGKGVRPDGRRHPHSWSIVDENDALRWLRVALLSGSDDH